MKRRTLAEHSNSFVATVEEGRNLNAADRQVRRRLESARRRLIRSIVRILHGLSDDQLLTVTDYVLLVTM
jgi:hypothetical protein